MVWVSRPERSRLTVSPHAACGRGSSHRTTPRKREIQHTNGRTGCHFLFPAWNAPGDDWCEASGTVDGEDGNCVGRSGGRVPFGGGVGCTRKGHAHGFTKEKRSVPQTLGPQGGNGAVGGTATPIVENTGQPWIVLPAGVITESFITTSVQS